MPIGKKSFAYDLMLRASGIALALIGALSLRHLYHLVHMPPRHEATLAEMGLSAVGFLGCSFGAGLVTLGAHIHDRVPISPRWAGSRPVDRPRPSNPERSSAEPWGRELKRHPARAQSDDRRK